MEPGNTIVIPSESKHPQLPVSLSAHRPQIKTPSTITGTSANTRNTIIVLERHKRTWLGSPLPKATDRPMCFYFNNPHRLLCTKPEQGTQPSSILCQRVLLKKHWCPEYKCTHAVLTHRHIRSKRL